MSRPLQLRIVTSGKVAPVWQEFNARLDEDPEFIVIKVQGDGLESLLAVKSEQPAVVILNCPTEANGISSHLFAEHPDMVVLKLDQTGRAFFEQLLPHVWEVTPATYETLSTTLRLAVEDPVANRRPT